jgi:branched-subunit amino acid ABC-type transport system permease component
VDFIQNCIDGVMFGSAYALLAIGFTLTFGVMRRLNLSYGPSIMLGAFLGTFLYVHWNAEIFTVAAVTIVGTILAGVYVERLCFRAIRQKATLASMVSSFVIWMQLEEFSILLLPERTYPFPALGSATVFELGPFFLRSEHLFMFLIALFLVFALHFMLYRTHFGLLVRAVSENPEASRFMGIHINAVMFWAFVFVSTIGGITGYLILSTDQQITPHFGLWATFKGLVAMMLGGMGSLPGAILGGLLLGVVEAQSLWYLGNDYKDLSAYFLLFIVLVLRPGGLLGKGLLEREDSASRRV